MPAGLHAVEASHVSISSLSSFRTAIGRAVWSSGMPVTSTPVLLNLLNGPVGVVPAFHVIWARFSMLRRYLACWPDEVPRVYRMLDLTAWGAKGHGPVHLLLDSASQIGFVWDGVQQFFIRESLPPLRMLAGPIQHFRSAVLQAWHFKVTAGLARRDGCRGVQFADIKGSLQLLVSPQVVARAKKVYGWRSGWLGLE